MTRSFIQRRPAPASSPWPGLRRVITGGQTGVDQAALRAALDAGLEIGGWCPPGRACEDGSIPDRWPLVETPRERSDAAPEVARSLRTEWNVRDADATLVLRPTRSADAPPSTDAGTTWTEQAAKLHHRPLRICDPAVDDVEPVAAWLRALAAATLHVAGPSERTAPGIGVVSQRWLRRLWTVAAVGARSGSASLRRAPD